MKRSKQEIKSHILQLTKKRGTGKSVSPSQVARDLFSDIWKDHLDEVRSMAGELQSERLISVTQNGKSVDPNKVKGPIEMTLLKHDE